MRGHARNLESFQAKTIVANWMLTGLGCFGKLSGERHEP